MLTNKFAITYSDIESASHALQAVAHRTPVLTSRQANETLQAEILFKCENFQRTGSFKFRGAYNAISRLSNQDREKGVIAFSSGNHAQAVALASQLLNVKATIVMPSDAPAAKLAATRGYGAEVICYDRTKENREEIANRLAAERGAIMIPPFNQPHVIAGQGSAAKELIESAGRLDYLFVCVGGGGLLAGSAIAAEHLSPGCKVIGVEPEAGDDARQSLQNGKIVEIALPQTIADGAQTQRIGELVFPIIRNYVKDIVTVSDKQLRAQMRFFAERMKMVVEPTGCLAAAAAMNGAIDISSKRVGVIVSGGNVDLGFFATCISE